MTFSEILLDWYLKNARQLPWRENKDPYRIWVSEIILQQTRIDQGLPFYLRFMKQFPNVATLHQATEDQVLRIWQGLGYYSRARNMKEAARQIAEDFHGQFPRSHQQILSLKGIGPYTAAAISSICFDLPTAVVDGNVYRVLSRYFNIDTPVNSNDGQKQFAKLANTLILHEQPGDYNQAIMEFGARVCVPVNPECQDCPLNHACGAFAKSRVAELPIKLRKLKIKNQFLHFFYITNGEQFLIEKRGLQSIWKGLYQLPLIETSEEMDIGAILESERLRKIIGDQVFDLVSQAEMKHKLTHRNLWIRFYHIQVSDLNGLDFEKILFNDWHQYAFPKPIVEFLSCKEKE